MLDEGRPLLKWILYIVLSCFIKITMCERIRTLRVEADRFHEEREKCEITRECNLIKTVISYIFNLDYVFQASAY